MKWIVELIVCIFLLSIVIAIPNPSPIYCKEMGYTYNETHCILDEENSCELWAFHNGECGKEYVKELDCVGIGDSLLPGHECCEGLASINVAAEIDGLCGVAVGSFGICAPCGNGVCDSEHENKCNCAEDCLDKKDGGSNNEQKTVQSKIKEKVQNINTNLEIKREISEENNKTKLKVKLSNGKGAEIKIMPETASERAIERLGLKACNEENNCTIVLKEVGKGDGTKLAYEVQAERHFKILWLFKAKAQVKAEVDAETGEIISVKKPWWSFLAF